MTDTAMNSADSAQDAAAIWLAGYHKGQHNAMSAPTWWKCDTHGPAKAGAWGCPECVREMRTELAELKQSSRTYFLERNSARDALRRRQKMAEAWQGGMSNAELLAAWRQKLPSVEPSDRELTAFALGVEVGCGEAGSKTS